MQLVSLVSKYLYRVRVVDVAVSAWPMAVAVREMKSSIRVELPAHVPMYLDQVRTAHPCACNCADTRAALTIGQTTQLRLVNQRWRLYVACESLMKGGSSAECSPCDTSDILRVEHSHCYECTH